MPNARLYDNLILAWNLLFPPRLTRDPMEHRKIYHTHMYSRGHEGHEFNEVLSDAERRAIMNRPG